MEETFEIIKFNYVHSDNSCSYIIKEPYNIKIFFDEFNESIKIIKLTDTEEEIDKLEKMKNVEKIQMSKNWIEKCYDLFLQEEKIKEKSKELYIQSFDKMGNKIKNLEIITNFINEKKYKEVLKFVDEKSLNNIYYDIVIIYACLKLHEGERILDIIERRFMVRKFINLYNYISTLNHFINSNDDNLEQTKDNTNFENELNELVERILIYQKKFFSDEFDKAYDKISYIII